MSTGKRPRSEPTEQARENNSRPEPTEQQREENWHPDCKGVVHQFTLGDPPPPKSRLAFDATLPSSEPLPRNVPISGSLLLADVPGSHLDYIINLEVGELLENEIAEKPHPHSRRFIVVMLIHETFVPESHRGQKLGEKLAFAAFALAASRGWGVRPTCSYIWMTYLRGEDPQCPDSKMDAKIAVYQHEPPGQQWTLNGKLQAAATSEISEVTPRMLVLFSWLERDLFRRRMQLEKKKAVQLVEMLAKKLPPQHTDLMRARALPPGPSTKAYMVELVLQAEFPRPTGFYRWADPIPARIRDAYFEADTKEAVS